MPAVSCPCCDEIVRLPAASLPQDASIECPWCGETSPATDWQGKLPPLAVVIDANGVPIEFAEPLVSFQDQTVLTTAQAVAAAGAVIDPSRDDLIGSETDVVQGNDDLEDVLEDRLDAIDAGDLDGIAQGPDADEILHPNEPEASQPDPLQAGEQSLRDELAELLENESEEADAEVDLDETIDLDADESDELSGQSIILQEEATGDSAANQPTIEEIENAWDASQDWDYQTPSNEEAAATEHPSVEACDVGEECPEVADIENTDTVSVETEIAAAETDQAAFDTKLDEFDAGVAEPSDEESSQDNWSEDAVVRESESVEPAEATVASEAIEAELQSLVAGETPIEDAASSSLQDDALEDLSLPAGDASQREPRHAVGLDDDEPELFEPRPQTRRPRDTVQLLKVAAPTLVALPIIAGILYASGINLGFGPFTESGDDSSAAVSTPNGETEASSAKKQPPAGRTLVDTDEVPMPIGQGPDRGDEIAQADPLDADDVSPRTAASSAGEQADDPESDLSPSEIVAGLFRSDAPDQTSGSDTADNPMVNIDEMIQELDDDIAALPELEADDQAAPETKETIAMRARKQWIERARKAKQARADEGTAMLNSATLSFPTTPPSAEGIVAVDPVKAEDPVQQASAEATFEPPAMTLPAEEDMEPIANVTSDAPDASQDQASLIAPENDPQPLPETSRDEVVGDATLAESANPEPNQFSLPRTDVKSPSLAMPELSQPELSQPEPADPEITLPESMPPETPDDSSTEESSAGESSTGESNTPVESQVSQSPELTAALDRAARSLEELRAIDAAETGRAKAMLLSLIAFRDASSVAGLSPDADSPTLARFLQRLAQPEYVEKLTPLCGEWVGYRKRATDGMLVIGTLINNDAGTIVKLDNGTEYAVRVAGDAGLKFDARCVLLGTIGEAGGEPLIEIVAGTTLP